MAPTNHDEMAELLGAYALDAVEADEAELLARHLETCPRCRDELRAHRETAGLLGYLGGPAPFGLWDQIAAGATASDEAPPALRLPSASGAGSGPSVVATLDQARRRRRFTAVATAAATVAAAAAVVFGVQVHHLDHQTHNLNAAFHRITPAPSMSTVNQALATPGARRFQLTSTTRTALSLSAVILPSGQGYLYNANLDPLAGDRTYQLWGMVGDQRISYGLLGSDPGGVQVFRAGPGVSALAVTNEVAGGVVRSQRPIVVLGALQA